MNQIDRKRSGNSPGKFHLDKQGRTRSTLCPPAV